MKIRNKTYLAFLIPFMAITRILLGAVELPQFLPSYYSPAFDLGPKKLAFVQHTDTDDGEATIYETQDKSLRLTVENVKCDYPKCRTILINILATLNIVIKNNSGRFVEITDSEACAEIIEDKANQLVLIYTLPASVQVWTYRMSGTGSEQVTPKYKQVRRFVDRQRYEQAFEGGNIDMGHWGMQIYRYANQLYKDGQKEQSLTVLKNLLATMPFNYKAHLDFIKRTDDSASAANSAEIVFKNAEDRELIAQAAKYLGKDVASLDSIPLLDKNETGLQLILVPLPPCSLDFIEEAAKTYRQITDIPVKIRRLRETWKWKSPKRFARQRTIQSILIKLKGANTDFTGWTKDRYIEELQKAVETEDALLKYRVNNLINKAKEEPGQYLIDPYLDRFCDIIAEYRSADSNTMYVGITETNIYSDNNNFVFSSGRTSGKSPASILSYYMMLAKTLDEEFESRQRLTERIAKELVPASLKQLGIPRSTDPTCPYSYSSGVPRLDQKTLKLSSQVRRALRKLKEPTSRK